MAKKLDSFTFNGRGGPSRYPWKEWLDGDIWLLSKGEDFDCSPDTFRTSAYNAASYRKSKVQTHIDGDNIVIQAVPERERQRGGLV